MQYDWACSRYWLVSGEAKAAYSIHSVEVSWELKVCRARRSSVFASMHASMNGETPRLRVRRAFAFSVCFR